jgi:hypothetical protein
MSAASDGCGPEGASPLPALGHEPFNLPPDELVREWGEEE